MKFITSFLLLAVPVFCFAGVINPNLTAAYNTDKHQVELKWQHTDNSVYRFMLQRSTDNRNWITIFTINKENFSSKKQEHFNDRNHDPTMNYYRLQLLTDQGTEVTNTIMVIIGSSLNTWIMFPVPVRDVLNLQYNGSEVIQGVVAVIIKNMSGYVFCKKRFSSLNRTIQIPVDNLGRGTYDVSIVINERVVWNQRFIK